MTNMEGFGLILLILVIGIPFLIIATIFGYFFHRNNFEKSQNQIDSQTSLVYVNYADAIRDVLIRPKFFFMNLTEGSVSLYVPFILIVVSGFFISFWYTLSTMASEINILTFTKGDVFFLALITITAGIVLIFLMLVIWIIVTLACYSVSIIFKGTGTLKKTAQNIGYAQAFGLIIVGVFTILITAFVLITHLFLGTAVTSLWKNPLLTTIITIGTILIEIWAAYLMVLGLQYARNLPFVKAVISVAVPLGLFYLVYTYTSVIPRLY